MNLLLFTLIVVCSNCQASPLTYDARENKVLNDVLRSLLNRWKSDPVPVSNSEWTQWKPWSGKTLAVNGFLWKDCGGSGDLGKVTSLTVQPDPLPIPGNVTVSFSASLSQDVSSPVQLSLQIKKKVFVWVPIPCVDNLGSCDYEDVCKIISSIPCPPVFKKYNIPCNCPIKAGNYKLPMNVLEVNPVGIPSWLEKGDYQATVTLKQNGKEIFCIFVEFSLTN